MEGDSLNRFFVGDVPDMPNCPTHWVFGHTHENILFTENGCTYGCNPYGYSPNGLNPEFDVEGKIEL